MRAVVVAILLCLAIVEALGRDGGQWAQADPTNRSWYTRQMQPDNVTVSCCGPADAYWADKIEIRDGKFFAIITDDRDDLPRGRPHIPMGTAIEIPPIKFVDPRRDPNPEGHGIVFVSSGRSVFCYFNPPGDG